MRIAGIRDHGNLRNHDNDHDFDNYIKHHNYNHNDRSNYEHNYNHDHDGGYHHNHHNYNDFFEYHDNHIHNVFVFWKLHVAMVRESMVAAVWKLQLSATRKRSMRLPNSSR